MMKDDPLGFFFFLVFFKKSGSVSAKINEGMWEECKVFFYK